MGSPTGHLYDKNELDMEDEFRVVPAWPNYRVNREGIVLNKYGRRIKHKYNTGSSRPSTQLWKNSTLTQFLIDDIVAMAFSEEVLPQDQEWNMVDV